VSHSICLRLVDWLQGVTDHVTQQLVKHLRRAQMHSQPAGDVNEPVIVGFLNARPERYRDNPAAMSSFGDRINELNARALVSQLQEPIANRDFVARSYNDFLNHQPSPLGKNYLGSLIPNRSEVEGRRS